MAKAKLIQNYRASLALDAATSGTYDMLREYVQNESFKKYMVDNKIVSADKVDEFVAEVDHNKYPHISQIYVFEKV
jgi:hypothetical protein